MEQTPFDASHTNPVDLRTPHHTIVRGPRLIWGILALLLLLILSGIGIIYWVKVQEQQAKLESLRDQLKTIVLADNALVLEVLEIEDSSHITYAEFFKRTDKNKEERDTLIRRIRAIEAGAYSQQTQNFVRLMELESEFVRAEEAVSRQNMELSSRSETLKNIATTRDEAQQKLSEADNKFVTAPYEENYSARLDVELAKTKADQAQAETTEAVKLYKKANDDLKGKIDEAKLAVDDWIRAEPQMYPSFAPSRNIMDLLIRWKNKYNVGDSTTSDSDKSQSNAPTSQAKQASATATPKVSLTPTSTFPTRLHSSQPLQGERFPETRIREITPEEIAQLTDDDLRYAVNEMYARYGLTFKNKAIQANFKGLKWYQPNDGWTVNQVEQAFTKTERRNLETLTTERSHRQSSYQ